MNAKHDAALRWFATNAGKEMPWLQPLNGLFLANKAKGIHKPAGWIHALSVRKSLGSTYDDLLHWDDRGRWKLRYSHEGSDPEYFSNAALRKCMTDRVPVGVLVQTQPKPNPRYLILGLAQVESENYQRGFFDLVEHPDHAQPRPTKGASVDLAVPEKDFDPANGADANDRVMRSIAVRRGQPQFRKRLLEAYGAECAVTGCASIDVLEAAHIAPYMGTSTNHVQNGVLLRADIHTLFDLALLTIEPRSLTVVVHPSVYDPTYRQYHGKQLRLPKNSRLHPSRKALEMRWAQSGQG